MSIVGIDLGTTNSLVAVFQDGAPKLIANAHGETLTPSVVGVDDNGEILVGKAAAERLITHPDRTVATFKRLMGTNQETRLAKLRLRPEELSALVLKSLKADAEARLGAPVTEAVISVPAYFSDAQRKATKAAGELAGFTVERLINEPTAAAIAYGLHQRGAESRFLVFDLGGGTFDVSVLELFEGIMEVHATAGDNFLGGEDWVDAIMAEFLRVSGIERARLTPVQTSRLRNQAEEAKRKLTSAAEAEIKVTIKDKAYNWRLDRALFERLAEPLLQRLRAPVERALRDAELKAAELDAVVLVGGATRMPMVRSLAARMFGQFPTAQINPDEVVALGAAVQAALKSRDAALNEVVMTDVCPYTLGVEIAVPGAKSQEYMSGRFLPIIERNCTVPVSRVDTLSTIRDNQREVQLTIYQGESRLVKNNIKLGSMSVKLPPKPAGEECIDVRFTYDINGILEVESKVVSTGEVRRIVIEGNPGVLTSAEIEQRLKALEKLKIHPRDQAENRALLARAERVYEEALGGLRDEVAREMDTFEAVLALQDEKKAAAGRERLAAFLDRVEAGWSA
jgi:molecular chaperone HscC